MNKVDLSKYEHHRSRTVKEVLWYLVNSLFFVSYINPSSSLKVFLLRLFGAKVGKRVVIKPGVNIKTPCFLEIGNHVWIGENVWIDNLTKVKIGGNCCISQGAMILTGNHDYKSDKFGSVVKEVVLEDGVWIGAKAVVCGGVICESHSVLTVGSVATGDLKAYNIYQGNPAILKTKRNIS